MPARHTASRIFLQAAASLRNAWKFLPIPRLFLVLAGMIASIAADVVDVMIFEKFGGGFWGDNYHKADKILDIYYLAFAFFAARKWQDVLARRTAKILFLWRFVGFMLFGQWFQGIFGKLTGKDLEV